MKGHFFLCLNLYFIHNQWRMARVMNQPSLIAMAKRQMVFIASSSFRSRLLKAITCYLELSLKNMEERIFSDEEKIEMEKNLEALEMALHHLWIDVPYNEILFLPKSLPEEQMTRLKNILHEVKKENRKHLKIAFSRAA
ncbi:MAG TPA: hypothetical protein DDW49_11095 [Deltaproteobacteria bacterium]|nr:MAG: hypothetical protein A2048_02050 [Deltaproteobacteria bacterium GWA2_45_12]HBF13911.1 hypothetical protein [Deltaproteobacteria bacterium]